MTEQAIPVLQCWRCDFGSGQRGCDRCPKCDGTGSVYWAAGRAFPYTPEGEKRAKDSLKVEHASGEKVDKTEGGK